MMMSLNKALTSTRERIAKGEKGFTLIELLIVVLIIGVLAAIAIPIYLTTQATAKDNVAKTTVTDAKTAIVAYYTQNGTLPEAGATNSLPGAIFASSPDVEIQYVPGTGSVFCISANYKGSTTIYKATDTTTSQTSSSTVACS